MSKKLLALVLSGMLVLPVTGCNANVTFMGKEILSIDDSTEVEETKDPVVKEEPKTVVEEFTDEEILEMLVTGEYTLTIDDEPFVYTTGDMLTELYDGDMEYYVEYYEGAQYLIQISSATGENFVTFLVHTDTLAIDIVEINHNGEYIEGEKASQALAQVVYNELFNPEDGTLTKKQMKTKEEQKDNTSKEQPKKEQPKEEKKQETPKTCKWCYTNQLPSGSGENDKCKECQQENWNFICTQCNKNMSLEEYHSYGEDTGMCPPCYDKYIQSTQDTDVDHKHYYCDRCGKDVTGLNFLQNFEGFDYICEGCLLDLGY